MRILLVEDDPAIATGVTDGLARYGFDVEHVTTGAAALELHPTADLVLLDLGLPDRDGIDVCRDIRNVSDVPIIIVTARSEEVERVVGLEIGADDYLSKPFGVRELVARMRAVLRRTTPRATPAAEAAQPVGGLVIDRLARRVNGGGQELALAPKEFDLLVALADHPGVVRRREDLISEVWDAHWFGSTRTLDVHVGALRRKLGSWIEIQTVRGVGFRLEEVAAP